MFADLISREFDGLITVDPHLHRFASLGEIYAIPAVALDASGLIGSWVRDHVQWPVVFGPDAESAQWVEEIARKASCPWAVFMKERKGDRDVRLTLPALDDYRGRTPVLADDIISSGRTMIDAARLLVEGGMPPPVCIGVHALFDEEAAAEIEAVARSLLTSDSMPNRYSAFTVARVIAGQLAAVPA